MLFLTFFESACKVLYKNVQPHKTFELVSKEQNFVHLFWGKNL